MATNSNEAPKTDSKVKTVAGDMAQRSIFPTPAEAEQFLTACGERFADFKEQVFAAPNVIVDDDGNAGLDPAVYGADGMEVMVSLLRKKGAGGEVKAIVVAPIPSLELLLSTTEGRAFVNSIIYKELNHRAVRPLREAENVASVVDQIPTTVEGYITSSRDAGGLMEPFNELYKQINATMASAVPAWAKRRFTKPELRKAFESKGYALDTYPEIEEAGKNGSLFEKALAIGQNAAKRKGLGTEIFDRWLETRATKVYEPGEDEDEEELDLDALTESMLAEAEDEPEDATTEQAPAE